MGTKKDDQEALWNFYGGRYVYYLDWSDSFPDKHVKFYEIVVFQSAIHCISVVSIKLFKKKKKERNRPWAWGRRFQLSLSSRLTPTIKSVSTHSILSPSQLAFPTPPTWGFTKANGLILSRTYGLAQWVQGNCLPWALSSAFCSLKRTLLEALAES